MRKTKIIALILCLITSFCLLCSCAGAEGPKGEDGKDGSSFLTGTGAPADELGIIGDSYLDVSGDEWGLYVKGEDGWKLLGYIESEPAPLTISDLDGTYELSYVDTDTKIYHIGEVFAGMTLSADMIQVTLKNGVGHLSVDFGNSITTNITCTLEYEKLIMICENSVNFTGQPSSVYELSVSRDGAIYVVLEVHGDYYYVEKVS